jgi:hypothetical protein
MGIIARIVLGLARGPARSCYSHATLVNSRAMTAASAVTAAGHAGSRTPERAGQPVYLLNVRMFPAVIPERWPPFTKSLP